MYERGMRTLAPGILVFENIKTSKIDYSILPWEKATVSQAHTNSYQDNQLRNNSRIFLSKVSHPSLEELEQQLLGISYHCLFMQNPTAKLVNYGFDLLKYEVGEHFNLHADLIPGHPIYGKREVSLLAYLNDDYEGGEIHFPNQGLKYKPKTGDMLLFPSNIDYLHAGLRVTKGTKYVAASWFYNLNPQ